MKEARLESVAAALAGPSKTSRRSARFLLGAGCSVNACIPLAGQVVNYLAARYPQHYRRGRKAEELSYPDALRKLAWQSRYKLFNGLVGSASLNWGHIVLARLMQKGLVGRVLTTNFDDLLLRACALFGLHPAVHDLALANLRKPERGSGGKREALYRGSLVREPAVFYLHGRHNGFAQMHSPDQVSPQSESLIPVVADCKGGPWIVVGYSGESDPLFKALQKNAPFEDGFFWVNRTPPSKRIQVFLTRQQGAFVQIRDADEFMLQLLRATGDSVGRVVNAMLSRPVEAILELQASLKPVRLPARVIRIVGKARPLRKAAHPETLLQKVRRLFKRFRHREIVRLADRHREDVLELDGWVARACAALGLKAIREKCSNTEILRWFSRAKELCPSAVKAFGHWSEALSNSRADNDAERRGKWRRAFHYYREASGHETFRQDLIVRWAQALVTEHGARPEAVTRRDLDDAARGIKALLECDRRNSRLSRLLREVQRCRTARSPKGSLNTGKRQ